MSRWIDNFNASAFHEQYAEYISSLNDLKEGEITNPEILTEFARTKKVLSYISSMISLIDPELNSLNALNNSNSQLTASFNSFKNFQNSPENLNMIVQSNNQLDACLNSLKPLQTVIPTTPKKSLVAMLSAYDNAIRNALENINLPEVEKDAQEIKTLKGELLDDEDNIKEEIDEAFSDIKTKQADITSTFEWLLEDDESKESVKTKINTLFKNIENTALKADKTDTRIDELQEFYDEIFGQLTKEAAPDDADDQTDKAVGLKGEITSRLTELETLKIKHKKKYEQIIEDIESLLPNATNVGLASVFYDERDKLKKPIENWNKLFIGSLCAMTTFTIISFFEFSIAPLGYEYVGAKNWDQALTEILQRLPLYGPLAWLAIYSGRRRSEFQRLEQEFIHKEAFAKAYSSYKQQADKLDNNDPLLSKLLDRAIDAIAHNASQSLDGKQSDDTPINELVKLIPGLSSTLEKLKDKL